MIIVPLELLEVESGSYTTVAIISVGVLHNSVKEPSKADEMVWSLCLPYWVILLSYVVHQHSNSNMTNLLNF